jgi:7-cyano-7-deazaguanine synthase in queuosine biosynthesis
MKQTFKSILLFSGGLDSFIAWHYLHRPPVLFINARQSYADKELKATRLLARRCKMRSYEDNSFNLSEWEEKNYYIPYRNILFAMVGSLYAQKVYLIGVRGDRVDDNNPVATALMTNFFGHFNSNNGIRVTSPFYKMSKSQIVQWYVRQQLPIQDLLATRSCYNKFTPNQCGECPSCFRRWVALENNNIHEKYDVEPWKWIGAKEYIKNMKTGLYDSLRIKETIAALSKYRVIG